MLQMIVQADAASETVEELGELGTVMFCDLNESATAFQRNFVQQMKDCDEVNRCLRFIGNQVAAAPSPRVGEHEHDDEDGPPLVERLPASFATMKSMLQEVVDDLRQLNASQRQIAINYNHLVELSHVLQKCDDIFSDVRRCDSAAVPCPTLSAGELSAQRLADTAAPASFMPSSSGSSSVRECDSLGGFGGIHHAQSPNFDLGRRGIDGTESRLVQMPNGEIDLEDGLHRLHPSAGLMLSGEAQTRLGYIAGVLERAKLVPFEELFSELRAGTCIYSTPILPIGSVTPNHASLFISPSSSSSSRVNAPLTD